MWVSRSWVGSLLALAACAGDPLEGQGPVPGGSSSGEAGGTRGAPEADDDASVPVESSTSDVASSGPAEPPSEPPGASTSTTADASSTTTELTDAGSSEADTGDGPSDTWGPDHLPPRCGWDPSDGWYECYASGLAPADRGSAINCPPGLSEGASCEGLLGDDGCCDAQGDLWYCSGSDIVSLQLCVE